MKILVTGASGFVGPHLVRTLQDAGHVVKTANTPGQGGATYSLDLTDLERVMSIDFKELDGIINLAGLAAVAPSFTSPSRYLHVNGDIQTNLFEAASAQGATPKMLTISSGSLYDPASPLPLSELSAVRCTSPYGVSKRLQEEITLYYGLRGFHVMVARPFNHIGPGQSTGFIVPDLVKELAEAKRDRRTTIAVGTLSARRDYTDVRDICLAYLSLIELGRPGEVYNVCSGISHSGDELLNQLFSMSNTSGITSVLDPMKQRPIDTPNIYGTADKLFLDTGWTPTYSLEQTLSDVITEAGLR